jgi:hypothetical protein
MFKSLREWWNVSAWNERVGLPIGFTTAFILLSQVVGIIPNPGA